MKLPLFILAASLQACFVSIPDVTPQDAGADADDPQADCAQVQQESATKAWDCHTSPQPGWTIPECETWWHTQCGYVCSLILGDAGFDAKGCGQ